MQTTTVQDDLLAVQQQAFLGRILNATDAEILSHTVFHLARLCYRTASLVQIRRVGAPQSRLKHWDGQRHLFRRIGRQVDSYFAFAYRLLLGIEQGGGQRDATVGRSLVLQSCLHLNGRFFFAHFGRRNKHTPVVDMHLVGYRQPDVPVNARATVPAAVLLLRVVDTYCNYVRLAYTDMRSQVVKERRVTIRPNTQRSSVDKHFCIHIHTLEIDSYFAVTIIGRNLEGFTIPTYSRGEISAVVPHRCIGSNRSLNTPIVRQVQQPPGRIIVSRSRSSSTVTQSKPPATIEKLFANITGFRIRKHSPKKNKRHQKTYCTMACKILFLFHVTSINSSMQKKQTTPQKQASKQII